MISKAQKIDSDEEVEGNFVDTDFAIYGGMTGSYGQAYFIKNGKVQYDSHQIDPSTLKHSFDNGKTWRTEEEINSDLLAMDALRRLKDK